MTSTFQLIFGRNIPGGGFVTDNEWFCFCQFVIASRFDAFTVVDAIGFWKGEQERTKVVTISTDNREGVQVVAERFKTLFNQEAVAIQELPAMQFV